MVLGWHNLFDYLYSFGFFIHDTHQGTHIVDQVQRQEIGKPRGVCKIFLSNFMIVEVSHFSFV